MKQHLIHNYYAEIEEDAKAFFELFKENRPKVFGNDINFFIENNTAIWTAEELEKATLLRKNMGRPYMLRMGIYQIEHNEQGEEMKRELVGWTFGYQKEWTTFYMTNTAIFETHRRKGIYTALLNKVLALLKDKGFRRVTSRHGANNNAVLIPKLKAGFVISGLEISEAFGILVHLTYFFKEEERKIMAFRVGKKVKDNPTVSQMIREAVDL